MMLAQKAPPVTRLYLELDGSFYGLTRTEGAWQLVQLQGKRQGSLHEVRIAPDGRAWCSCPDAYYRNRPCKHVIALTDLGLLRPLTADE